MFSLAVNFGSSGQAWSFLFNKKENVEAAIAKLDGLDQPLHSVLIQDDYGSTATITRNQINGWLVEHMELTKGAMIFRNMHLKRMEAEFMNQFQNDPALANLRGGGPGIINPMLRQNRAS